MSRSNPKPPTRPFRQSTTRIVSAALRALERNGAHFGRPDSESGMTDNPRCPVLTWKRCDADLRHALPALQGLKALPGRPGRNTLEVLPYARGSNGSQSPSGERRNADYRIPPERVAAYLAGEGWWRTLKRIGAIARWPLKLPSEGREGKRNLCVDGVLGSSRGWLACG